MNVRLEQGMPTPEMNAVSPRKHRESPKEILTEKIELSKAEKQVLATDNIKIAEARAGLAAEAMPEFTKNWLLREGIKIEKFSAILSEGRAEAEKGVYGNVWDVIEAFEATDRRVSDDVPKARRAFKDFVAELNKSDSSTTDKEMAQKIATKYFKDTGYKFNKNSVLQSLANGEEMNCAGRFKVIAATLEATGYKPDKEIWVNETADHIRVVLKTNEGELLIDGAKVTVYVPEDGTAEMPLNDYKRELLGLDPEQRIVHGGAVNKENFGHKKSWFGKLLDKWMPEEKHEIRNTRRGRYDNLKSSDPDNVSRLEHLIPGSVLALMQSQLLADANAVIERIAGGAVEKAKALAQWRGTKLAAGGGLVMAMYSACGPVIEKYSEAKSPDEAAEMIHSDISDVKLALEENINSVAKAVEIATKEWLKEKPKVDKSENEKTKNNSSDLTGAAKSGWTDSEIAEQLPIAQLEMTRDEMYLLFAERKLTYDYIHLIMEKADTEGEIDLSQPLTIDVGEARVLSPTFFKYFLQRGSKQIELGMNAGNPDFALPNVVVYINGKYVEETASTAAWQKAINELEDTNRVQTTANIFYNSPLKVIVNGTELSVPVAYGKEDKGELPGSEEWRYGLGGVSDSYIAKQAQIIAVGMGEETNGHWKTARDRIHEKDRRLYLYKLATNYHAVPIGFYESEDGRSWPIYNEKEKEQMSEDNNKFYRSVTPDERTYMQMALVNEGNDIAEAIISPPIRVTPAEKNNSLAQSILAAIEAKEKHE